MARKLFRTVEESIELEKSGVPAESGFEYVYSCEEVDFGGGECQFDIHGDIDAQLDAIREAYGKHGIKIVESGEQPFDEFTAVICEAYVNEL